MQTIVQIMTGKVAMVPKITANLVDIRDVAQAHVNCLTVPDAVGKWSRSVMTVGREREIKEGGEKREEREMGGGREKRGRRREG